MNRTEAETITANLQKNICGVKYGTVAVTLTLHDGRIVEVEYSRNERNKGGLPARKRQETKQ